MVKVTPAHHALAYTVARAVYNGAVRQTDAVSELTAAGMAASTASFAIGNLRQMLNGAEYNRGMSIPQTEYFVSSIRTDDGIHGFKKAVIALEKHLAYIRKYTPSTMPGLTALLANFQAQLKKHKRAGSDAVSDLPEAPSGNGAPDRATSLVSHFKRDPQVRSAVVKRAKGRCEFCGMVGFAMPNGRNYVETHHIIGLSKQGPDTLDNVIGLCANHHREAHFGLNAASLEAKFVAILASPGKR